MFYSNYILSRLFSATLSNISLAEFQIHQNIAGSMQYMYMVHLNDLTEATRGIV